MKNAIFERSTAKERNPINILSREDHLVDREDASGAQRFSWKT